MRRRGCSLKRQLPLHLDHAIRLFQSAIAKDARFALAYAGLGQAYWAQYRETQQAEWTSKATAAILDALRIDPDQPEVRISLAIMYQGIGRPDAAQEELRKVIAAQPRNDNAHRLLAGISSIAVNGMMPWRNCIRQSSYGRITGESQRAWVRVYRAGRLDDAIKAYQRVVELQPDSARGLHMLGTVIRVRAVPPRRSTTTRRPTLSIPPRVRIQHRHDPFLGGRLCPGGRRLSACDCSRAESAGPPRQSRRRPAEARATHTRAGEL